MLTNTHLQPGDAPGASVGKQTARERSTAARLFDILLVLTRADMHSRYGRGPWLLVKWIVDPFAVVGVYLVLVALLLDRSQRAPGLTLACAVIPFQLLMQTVVNGLTALHERRAIVGNMAFPRFLLPISSALTESVAFAASLLLLPVMMIVYGIHPNTAALWLPVVLVVNLGFAVALAYPAVLAGIWVHDIAPLLVSFVRTMFFLAPGLVALDQITGSAHDWVRLNPLTGVFESYRSVLLYGHSPAAWELLYPLAVAAVIAALFIPIYMREQGYFARTIY